jgi:HEAT repeat protein
MTAAVDTRQRFAALHDMDEARRLTIILEALEDAAPAVREQAVRYAARYLEPARLVRLVANDERDVLRNGAIAALERQGPYAVRPLELVLAEPVDAELAMFTLQVLARIADHHSAAAVLPFVRHANANVAQAAIEALGAFRATESVPDLLALMGGNLWLQLASVNALGEIGDARAAAPLLELAPDSLLAIPALQAIGKLPAAAVAAPLAQLVCDVREPASREAAILALADVMARDPLDPALVAALDLIAAAADEPTLLRTLQGALLAAGDARGTSGLRVAAATIAVGAPVAAAWGSALVALSAEGKDSLIAALLRARGRELGPLVALMHREGEPRIRSILVEFSPPEAITPGQLLQSLRDPHALVRAAACRALGPLGMVELVPALVELLKAGCDEERAAAATALACQPARSLAALAACLESRAEPELLVQALGVLEVTGGQLHLDRVLELAHHAAAPVRRAALRVLSGLVDRRVEPLLLKALADVDPEVPAEALELLVQRGGERTHDNLLALLSLSDSLRFRVIRALGRLRLARAAPKLEALYPDCPLHEQLEVIGALVLIAAPGVRDFLQARLSEPGLELRRAAARGLASLAVDGDLEQLASLALDGDWNVRNEAARGLARLPLESTRPLLLTLARDVESVVAVTAREAFSGTPARTWALSS